VNSSFLSTILSTTDDITQRIFFVFRARGDRHYGENVSELQHALQCAEFASRAGESDAIVLACLLHDYGHLLHDLGEQIAEQGIDARHEELGATLLTPYFPPSILEPIRQHVAAKRYLCLKDPMYARALSDSSQRSLQLQGGPMSPDEATEFETNPHFHACITVRIYDDKAKVLDMPTRPLESYENLIRRFASQPDTATHHGSSGITDTSIH
jgi:phosphonate degradation associated HDIG domain protein